MSHGRQPGEQRPGHVAEPERSAIEEITTEAGQPTSRLGRAFGFDGRVGLDVPVERPHADRARRERAVALTGLVAVVALVGVGVVGREQMAAFGATPEPTAVAAAATASPTRPARTRRPATPPPPTPEPVRLPDLPNQLLPDAPSPIFLARDAQDAVALTWRPGRPDLVAVATIPDAYADVNPALEAVIPSGSGLVVAGEAGSSGLVRVVGFDGSKLWEAELPTANFSGWAFSEDGRLGAIAVSEGAIALVPLDGDPDGLEVAEAEVLRATPTPPPSGRPNWNLLSQVPDFTELVGFDDAVDWLYVRQSYAGQDQFLARVSVETGTIEALDEIPVDIAPNPSGPSLGSADPATGRRVDERGLGLGAPELRVLEQDGEEAFVVDSGSVAGWGWLGNGSLAVLVGGGTDQGVQLVVVDEAGNVGRPVFETAEPTYTAVIGARDGHVLLGFNAEAYGPDFELAMVRVSDGAVASLVIEGEERTVQWWTSAWLDDLELDD